MNSYMKNLLRQKYECVNLITKEKFNITYEYCICTDAGDGKLWRVVNVKSRKALKVVFKTLRRTPYYMKGKKRAGLFLVEIEHHNEDGTKDLLILEKTSLEMSEILDTWTWKD